MKTTMKKLITAIIMICMLITMIAPMAVMAADTGTITVKDSTTGVAVAGRTLNAYKVFDVEPVLGTDGVAVTGYLVDVALATDGSESTDTVKTAVANYFVSKLTGELAVTGNTDTALNVNVPTYLSGLSNEALDTFAREILAIVKNAGASATAAVASGNDMVFNDLPLGYYVIEDVTTIDANGDNQVVSSILLDTTDETINLKADVPTVDKSIWEKSTDDDTTIDAAELTEANTATVGEVVNYAITSKVPDTSHYKAYTFVITDTLSSGLTYNDDLKVTIDGVEYEDYTEAYDSATQTITLTFGNMLTYGQVAENVGDKIEVTYSATVNENAVIEGAGNTNNVKLTYSNDPDSTESGDPGTTTETPEDKVVTYLTQVKIAKVDEAGKALPGASFTIEGDGVKYEIKETTDAQGNRTTEVVTVKVDANATTNVSVAVDEDGYLVFSGLGEGTYTITETVAPGGYDLLDAPIEVTIDCTLPLDEDGNLDETKDVTWTYNNESATDGVYTINVVNKKVSSLPGTGGIGTTIFVVVGVALMGTAVVLFAIKKKASKKSPLQNLE